MKLGMIGTGYVGLTTGACFAELGHHVACMDIDAQKVADLTRAVMPIYEPGLQALVEGNLRAGRLRFSTDAAACAADADAVFLAVGTPSAPNGDIDLSFLETAARQIAPVIKPGAVVVVKSTVVTGTAHRIRDVIAAARGKSDFHVASNPEFLREGSAIGDFLEPDRVVIGADDDRAGTVLEALYAPLSAKGVPVLRTSTANAELIKYAANAFLALKLGFINDVANLCERVDGDVGVVAQGIGLDKRIGRSFLQPGPGFGGSCFPKDTRAFAALGQRHGAPQTLIESLVGKNEDRKTMLANRILDALGPRREEAVVAVLGLAFKANTDDVREAASLSIIPMLQQAGVRIRAHDPQANAEAGRHLENVQYFIDAIEAAAGADAVVILTEWESFRTLDLDALEKAMRGHVLVDYRNLFTPAHAAAHGLRYLSLGRPTVGP